MKAHNQEKQSLNSLVQLRNDFAHGKSPNTSINTITVFLRSVPVPGALRLLFLALAIENCPLSLFLAERPFKASP